ncbi:MAG: hypothetical protein WCY92_04650 [Novosphingobium sp.]|uniref:hypothetical protein n=1 Tax=Tsuneonella sp. CC-YZS046 TaxID=3042152 RepID=UPI002D77DAEB|nr:hypothetical protein [Tsuneonella sp. CC-YZS046]WRO65128.1 hypothetical protein U8326_08545 [Tsuneonella sp. CC-YZS046]
MKISKLAAITLAAFATVPATSVLAQEADAAAEAPAAAPALAAGQTIYGPSGEEVATVVSVADGNVVVNTGTQEATLAATAFTQGEKGATIAFSKDELNAAIENANKQAAANHEGHQPATGAPATTPEGGQ